MWTAKSQIIDNAKLLNVPCCVLDDKSSMEIREKIIKKYCTVDKPIRLFERLISCDGICGEDVWKLVKDLAKEEDLYVFPEEAESKTVFVFKNSEDVVMVHGECANFTLYVADKDLSYLIASTVEDSLVVTGVLEDSSILEITGHYI